MITLIKKTMDSVKPIYGTNKCIKDSKSDAEYLMIFSLRISEAERRVWLNAHFFQSE